MALSVASGTRCCKQASTFSFHRNTSISNLKPPGLTNCSRFSKKENDTLFMQVRPCTSQGRQSLNRAQKLRATDGDKTDKATTESVDFFSEEDDAELTDLTEELVPQEKQMTFMEKLQAAFRIFFPKKRDESARIEAKKRLRMILVADRCNMTPVSMTEMKKSIVHAISDYVEVDKESDVDLSVSNDPDMGTIYSVSVPVKRVKSEYDADAFAEIEGMSMVHEVVGQEEEEDQEKDEEKESIEKADAE